MSSYYSIPRDLYATLQAELPRKVFLNTIGVLNEIAFRIRYNGNLKDNIEIGQCFCGIRDIATKLGISEDSVRTALKHLEKTQTLARRSSDKGQLLTILDKRIFSYVSKRTPDVPQTNPPPNIPEPEPKKGNRGTGSAKASPPNLLNVLDKYINKYTKDFATAQYEKCKEYHWAKSGKEPTPRQVVGWFSTKWCAQAWEESQPKVDRLYELFTRAQAGLDYSDV